MEYHMEYSDNITTTPMNVSTPSYFGSSSSSPPTSQSSTNVYPSSPPVILTRCAACKILRRRCDDKCHLAPYFPPTEPLKFIIAHRVFGPRNIIKMLQELPESQRADAVSSMVYEANARRRDPIYGSTGAIFQLQKQVSDLQAELAKAQAEIINMQTQQANLLALLCTEMSQPQENISQTPYQSSDLFYDDANLFGGNWEPLWT